MSLAGLSRRAAPGAGLRRPLAAAGLGTLALVLAVWGQTYLDRRPDLWLDGLAMWVPATIAWLAALWLQPVPEALRQAPTPILPGPALDGRRRRLLALGLAAVFLTAVLGPLLVGPRGGGLALLAYPHAAPDAAPGTAEPTNTFTLLGAWLWIAGLALAVLALAGPWRSGRRLAAMLRPNGLRLSISWAAVAVLAIMVLGAWFRFHDLASVPGEMTSDHTEKVLDVVDMVAGLRPAYLPRNAGREPLEFYWLTALVALGMPVGFMLLKVGMALISLLTIPVMYLFGKQVAGREVGLFAALLLALSGWHLLITRIGLRIAFSPLFAALTLYFLYRALESGRRNDFLALGFVLGAGLYGYSGFRPMFFVVPLVIALKLGHDAWAARRAGEARPLLPRPLAGHLAASAGMTLLVAVPMIRFALDRPEIFWARTFTRMTGVEQALQNAPLVQLAINLRNALLMFNITSDQAWFQNAPGRPALETIGGALMVLGFVTVLYRAWRRDWRVGMLLVIVPAMLVSSMLALAFPVENPSWSRAAGALPGVMVTVALPLATLGTLWQLALGAWGVLLWAFLLAVAFVTMARNVEQRYFGEYAQVYASSSHNTSEGAAVARAYLGMGVRLDHVYLVGWDNGWDYRALGIMLGDPAWNGLLWNPSGKDHVQLARPHQADPLPKLYLVAGPDAPATLATLRELFPRAVASQHSARVPGKDFWSVYVPSETEGSGG